VLGLLSMLIFALPTWIGEDYLQVYGKPRACMWLIKEDHLFSPYNISEALNFYMQLLTITEEEIG